MAVALVASLGSRCSSAMRAFSCLWLLALVLSWQAVVVVEAFQGSPSTSSLKLSAALHSSCGGHHCPSASATASATAGACPAAAAAPVTPAANLRLGTRASPLALAQAYETRSLIVKSFAQYQESNVELVKIVTKGDTVLNQALSEIGGKGLFTKELDSALLANEVDICVHSMKDVPTWIVDKTVLPCVLTRELTNDVFVSKKYKSIRDLPDGAIVGTASLRRKAQILAFNPRLKVVNFRGNVQTRLKKLESGEVDATLLALAGLRRLEMTDLLEQSEVLPWEIMLPAVAQGAIGIQCRSDDATALGVLAQLNHQQSLRAVQCERAFLEALDGNCRTPIAGQARIGADGQLEFYGILSKPDGSDMLRVERRGPIDQAEAIGKDAGLEIIAKAGSAFEDYRKAYTQSIN